MARNHEEDAAVTDIRDCRTIAALQHALDCKYRELVNAAQQDWQRLFGLADPSDHCASIRIGPEPSKNSKSAPRAGFLQTGAKYLNGKVRRRLA